MSALLKRPMLIAQPMALSIEPISICNLGCPECPTGMKSLLRPKGMLSVEQYQKMLLQLNKSLWHINLYFQGEPYMHPDFFELVTLTKRNGQVVSASTNAQYLNDTQALKTVESGLDFLTISFDGVTQEVYEQYRVNGQLNKVIEGTKSLVKIKKRLKSNYPIITAQFLVFKHNQHQIDSFVKLVTELGVNKIDIKTAQVYDSPIAKHRLTSVDKYSRYTINSEGSVVLKGLFKNKCWKAHSSSVITWDGKVIPCCFDKDARITFGDIYVDKLSSISKNKNVTNFHNVLLNNQSSLDICKNCPLSKKKS